MTGIDYYTVVGVTDLQVGPLAPEILLVPEDLEDPEHKTTSNQ